MGVFLMENFNVPSTDAVAARGLVLGGTGITYALASFVENSVTRMSLTQRRALNGTSTYYPIAIPIPSSKAFYLSFRARWPFTSITAGNAAWRLPIATVSTWAALNASTMFGMAVPNAAGTGWVMYANGVTTNPSAAFNLNEWVTLEFRRDADGTARLWVNDMLVYLSTMTVTAPATDYVFIGTATTGTTAGGATQGWDFADIVVVDPATDGLKNRPGSTGRVLSLPSSADVIAQWSPPAGITTPHNQLMANYPVPIGSNAILTGADVGLREQYLFGPVDTSFGGQILSVGIEKRIANAGGVSHVYTPEIDLGSGIVPLADVAVAAGSGYLYQPLYADKKPDGSNWTAADLAALKAGLSIKS